MTPEELQYLYDEFTKENSDYEAFSLKEYLLNKMSPRSSNDKVPRCLNCGTCVPEPKQNIYSEFCHCCRWVNKV